MTIGEYVAQIRREKNMSQRDLALKSGISNTEISRLEGGKRVKPSPLVLKALADAMSVEYSDFMKIAGYIEEVHDNDKFYELVFKDSEGNIVDIKRGVKEMFRRDEEWANVAYRVTHELNEDDKDLLKEMAIKFLERRNKLK